MLGWRRSVRFSRVSSHTRLLLDVRCRAAHSRPLRVFAAALGVSEEFFPSITDHSIDVLRMNNYAMPEGALTLDGELTGMV